MNTLERYILRQLLGPLGFFAFVLTGVIWLTQSLRVIDIVVNNGQGAQVFLEFTALLLPLVLSIVLQLGALAATVLTMHRLLSESEVSAMFASGVSRMQVARPVAVFGVGLMTILAIDTLYLMPTAAQVMRDRVAEVRGDLAAGLIKDGRFLNPADGLTVYIREITPQGELRGLMVQDSRDRENVVTYTAKRGYIAPQETAPALVMYDGMAQRLDPGGRNMSLLRFDSWAYDLSSYIGASGERFRKPSERYVDELLFPDERIREDRPLYGKFLAEGHEQLSAPLYGLVLPLLAAAVMLNAAFSRRGMTGAIVMALLVGAGVRVLGLAAKSAVSSSPELWPMMYAPPALGVLAALWLLTRRGAARRRGDAGSPPALEREASRDAAERGALARGRGRMGAAANS